MGKATVKFDPIEDGNFKYTLEHSKGGKVQDKIDETDEIFYKHGDTILFETDAGNFEVTWEHLEGSIKLNSPFKNQRPGLPKTSQQDKPFKSKDKVDTELSKATREALRQDQGFVARYRYFIKVDTPNGTFIDDKEGTYDC